MISPHRAASASPQPSRRWLVHLAVAFVLATFVAALYYTLLFTNRVLATGDILLYFYPYRDYVAAVLRTGQLPFWNPYIFAGAPLLANPQAAVLYPLHWPLIWLPVTKQIYWSAAIHAWIFGYGGYWLMRRWGYGAVAATVTALLLAGSGVVGGLIGHINQLNAAAWLPWAILCIEAPRPPLRWPSIAGASAGFGIVVALMLLAGHTQTVYIALFGVGMWVIWPLVRDAGWWLWRRVRPGAEAENASMIVLDLRAVVAPRLVIYIGGVLLGVLVSAPQLLVTLELSGLGLRSGGLDFVEATSLSLKPLQAGWALLPTYGLVGLEGAFGTPAYGEFVAYVGLFGLLLAIVGAWKGRGTARTFGLLFALLGLGLALGRWNPLYFVLHLAVPGFDLFRVPARWLLLYTLGMGALAGVGSQWLLDSLQRKWATPASTPARPDAGHRRWALQVVGALILLVLVAGDLWLAARALPLMWPTAPEAVYGVRTAPAHLLTDPDRMSLDPAAAGRFLGLSTITYDPGDMPDYQRVMLEADPPQLDERTFGDLVIAQKVQELLVPNLALFWRIPSVDGFDGGVLPLQRFNLFTGLVIPPDLLVPDGRLREQIREAPPTSLLNLMDVQYLITDKVKDLWFEDIFYDRQIGAHLTMTNPVVAVNAPDPFGATRLDLIATIDAPGARLAALHDVALPVASVTITATEGLTQTFTVTAGGAPGAQLADGALDSPLAAASGAKVAYRDVEGGKQEYRVALTLPKPMQPTTITVTALDPTIDVILRAATLVDERTGMFTPLLPSDRGHLALVHSGDVKIYENLDKQGRAWLAPAVTSVRSPQEAVTALRSAPPGTAVVEGGRALGPAINTTGTATITAYAPERVEVQTQSDREQLLVLADAFYPGWAATVDGIATGVLPANILFRGVYVPAGEHTVVFTFTPTAWTTGLLLAALGALLIAGGIAVAYAQRLRRQTTPAV
ncbi:MAG: YfhO family protein [Anaerolineales bacterium]|nr:YfhO family protein [Anaerolineales bacterium]